MRTDPTIIMTRPEMRKSKSGEWSVRYRIPAHDGQPEKKAPWKKTGLNNKVLAERIAEEYRKQLEDEINDPRKMKGITFGQYARKWHDPREENGEITHTTYQNEERWIRRIENSTIANIPIDKMTEDDLLTFEEDLKQKDFSYDQIRRTRSKADQILKDAKKNRVIKENPVDYLPKIKRHRKEERKSITEEQKKALTHDLKTQDKSGKRAVILLTLTNGLRRGEALGIKWKDIDLQKRTMRIERQIDANSDIRAPKDDSKRMEVITETTAEWLKEWREQQAREFYGGKTPPKDAFVCCNDHGKALNPANFDKWRRRYFVSLGLGTFQKTEEWYDKDGIKRYRYSGYKGVKLHELRHTFATDLIAQGTDLKTTQTLMGHKHLSTTAGYVHTVDENLKKAMDELESNRGI